MNIGMRIKEIRKAKRISAETIAEKLNVAPSTIYRYESGDIEKVSSTIMEQIADALGVSPSVLMGWDNIVIPNVKRIPILGSIIIAITPVNTGVLALLNMHLLLVSY